MPAGTQVLDLRLPLPHPALRDGVIKKVLWFVHWAMAIAQLMYLHLTIPSSGSTSEPVPRKATRLFRFPRSRLYLVDFRSPNCCGHRVFAALVFSGQGAGVSNSTDEKGHRATRPGSYTVYPAGLRVVSQGGTHG